MTTGPTGTVTDLDHERHSTLRPDPIRRAVVHRLTIAGRLHAQHLRDLERTPRAPARHAVVFCYRAASVRAPSGVVLASRLFLQRDIDEITQGRHDLPTVLRTLHARGVEFLRAGHLDPRRHLSTHLDPDLDAHAAFLGVATSTLQPAQETVDPNGLANTARAASVYAWQSIARLVDGTGLLIRVPDIDDTVSDPDIESTHTLAHSDRENLFTHRPWRWARGRAAEYHDPGSDDLARTRSSLDLLHHLISEPGAHRDLPTPQHHPGHDLLSRPRPAG